MRIPFRLLAAALNVGRAVHAVDARLDSRASFDVLCFPHFLRELDRIRCSLRIPLGSLSESAGVELVCAIAPACSERDSDQERALRNARAQQEHEEFRHSRLDTA
jgi:hypothetical protein